MTDLLDRLPKIALSHVIPVLNELERRGVSRKALFFELDLDVAEEGLEAGEIWLCAADFSRLYGHACRLLEAATSGRQDNSTISKDAAKILCYCVITCHTLRDAIERAVIFCRVGGPVVGDILELQACGDTATLKITLPSEQQDNASLLVCLSSMNLLHQLFSWLTGKSLRLQAVMLSHSDPQEVFMPGSLASQPLRWGCDYDALVFQADDLDLPVLRSAKELDQVVDYFPFNVQFCAGQPQTYTDTLRTILTNALQNNLPLMQSAAAAQLLHMSVATLRRKLQKEGSSFTQILKECQYSHALSLVLGTDIPFSEIANRIGYSDDRAFRRAFRSWTGLSPSAYRSQR